MIGWSVYREGVMACVLKSVIVLAAGVAINGTYVQRKVGAKSD